MKKPARQPSRTSPVPASLLAAALRAQGDGVVLSRLPSGGGSPVVVFANDVFLAMTGYAGAELAGHPHAALHADRTDLDRLRQWRRASRKNWVGSGEGYVVRRDGTTLYAAWSFSGMPDRAGRLTHLVATYRDTTQKRQLQEALVHAQRLDAVGRLAGGVAHDFNNLLSVINGYCEMLAAQLSDRPALREVNEIHRAGIRAATLTRQLLAFGRRTPMDPRVINFNRIVNENAEIIRRLIGTAGRLQVELAPDLPNARTDPTQFQQVLLNLVLNARDALRDRGCITIATGVREIKAGPDRRPTEAPPGRYVFLAVADNGTGMDAETQKHLFEPFFTTKPEGKGTGLGLALVYGVVQQSSGFVTVRSAVLAGSTFEVLLPEVNAVEEPAEDAASVVPLAATSGNEMLLVVEADEVVRKMIAGMLTAGGYRVMAARSPDEGLGLAAKSERPAQLAIAPVDGGEEMVRSLSATSPRLRVLWVSDDDAQPTVPWLPAARQAALSKPFALSEIVRLVRMLLDVAG